MTERRPLTEDHAAGDTLECSDCEKSGNKKTLQRCSIRCLSVWYCFKECQRADWKRKPDGHKCHCVEAKEKTISQQDILAEQLAQTAQRGSSNGNGKHNKPREIRIFMDGAFDLMHYGHMNAFRLGRSLGTHLVVGLNSDESIQACKGQAPLLNDEDPPRTVAACKFVDEVVPGVPPACIHL